MALLSLIAALTLGVFVAVVWRSALAARRAEFIRSYALPRGLFERLRKRRPELSLKDCQLVSQALRQFFLAHLKSGRQFVSMPSQLADDLWHEFILYTRNYDQFCRCAFGRFLHHTPAVALGSAQRNNVGLRRCWWYACREEHINPRQPTRLPLLFALDAKLRIADGFHYVPDCGTVRNRSASAEGGTVYCGGDFSSTGFDGGTDGFGDGGGADGSADGDGGGCGGGCGGD